MLLQQFELEYLEGKNQQVLKDNGTFKSDLMAKNETIQ